MVRFVLTTATNFLIITVTYRRFKIRENLNVLRPKTSNLSGSNSTFSSDAPFYIDRNLGVGEQGYAVFAQLRTEGFKRLNLISGDDRTLASKEFPI